MSTSGVLQMVPIQLQWERTLKAMDDVRECYALRSPKAFAAQAGPDQNFVGGRLAFLLAGYVAGQHGDFSSRETENSRSFAIPLKTAIQKTLTILRQQVVKARLLFGLLCRSVCRANDLMDLGKLF